MNNIPYAAQNTRHRLKGGVALMAIGAILALAACSQNGPSGENPAATASGEEAKTMGSITPDTLNVADAAIASGNPSMALAVSQSVLENDPNNVDALEHEGNAYYALNRCVSAEAAYQLALKNDAHASEAETGLGRCLLKTNPVQAVTVFQNAVADDPGNGDAWNDLGIAYDLTGNFAAAVDPYHKALLSDPSMTAAEVNLGLSLALSGHGDEALQYLGPLATGQEATPKIRGNYAMALVADGQVDQARDVLAIDLPPDQAQRALDGYQALVASSITAPPPPAPPAPTVSTVTTSTIESTPIVTSQPAPAAPIVPANVSSNAPVPLLPAASAAPYVAPAPAPVVGKTHHGKQTAPTQDADAAYVGPSPIPGAVSSSSAGASAPYVAPASPAPSAAPSYAAPPAAPVGPINGNIAVQVAALASEAAAQHSWDKLNNTAPSLLAGKSPNIVKATVHGKTYYRLRITGFSSKLDAAKFCAELSATGSSCTVANF